MSGPSLEARFVAETGTAAAVAVLAEPVLESMGYRLVLVRVMGGQGNPILEIMAERADGTMTVEDCRKVSNALSPVLDVHDPMPGSSYRLQVSSPGIDRPLVRPSDFDQWSGFEAKIEMRELIGGRRRFRGTLEGHEDGEARIEVDLGSEQGRQVLGLPIGMIGEARLVLTDELVRESLRRAKRREQSGDEPSGDPAGEALRNENSIESEEVAHGSSRRQRQPTRAPADRRRGRA